MNHIKVALDSTRPWSDRVIHLVVGLVELVPLLGILIVAVESLVLSFLERRVLRDAEKLKAAIKATPTMEISLFRHSHLAKNEEVVVHCIENGFDIPFVEQEVLAKKSVRDAFFARLEKDPNYRVDLRWGHRVFSNDRAIVEIAIQRDGLQLEFAHPDLQKDEEIVRLAIAENGRAIAYASDELRKNEEIALLAHKQSPQAVFGIDQSLANTPAFVEKLQKQHPLKSCFSSVLLKDSKYFATIVEWIGWVLQFLPESARNNKDLVRKAVSACGDALQYASALLQADEDIVYTAVKQSGLALRHASYKLKQSRKLVLEAVNQNGLALQFASPAQQKSDQVVRVAVQQNPEAILYAYKAIQEAAWVQDDQKLKAILDSNNKAILGSNNNENIVQE